MFLFCFEIIFISVLPFIVFFNPVGKNLVYFREFVPDKGFCLTAAPCWGLAHWVVDFNQLNAFNCILPVF